MSSLLLRCGANVFVAWVLSVSLTGNAATELRPDCRGVHCGAHELGFTGRGPGIWTYRNDGAQAEHLKISLSGLHRNTVTLVLTNAGTQPQAMPKGLRDHAPGTLPDAPFIPNLVDPLPGPAATTLITGQSRIWQVPQVGRSNVTAVPRPTRASVRAQARIDGFRYRIWVADEAWTPHMQRQLPLLAGLLFGTPGYDGIIDQYITDFGIQPWGPRPASADNDGLIPAEIRDIDIVIAPNGAGNIQFFDNAQLRRKPTSNEALALFIGSDGLACTQGNEALCVNLASREIVFALANNLLHELTHLVHYYYRAVRPGEARRYETWLEESVSSAHGYIVAMSRFPHTPVQMTEFLPWFGGKYVCSLTSIDGSPGTSLTGPCVQNYYHGGQAFIVFLAHEYGTRIFRALLNAHGRGADALDEAIRACGGAGFADAFRRWGSLLAILHGPMPAGYAIPAVRVGSHVVPAFDATKFAPFRKLPAPIPDAIGPYSHLPIMDGQHSGDYRRELDIAPGVAITLYAQ
ncbi:hypothetical protein [Burkholderia sp. Nafp2/4-1b]|uniref:M30 family zinc metallopeptidase n=1 Tax=Burkholderia sp. Nafp2/4-1b TaxID=2116686 RepID=UPI0013CE7EA0|nr:hypothetical protein [Burkholderia sp. Nafp2/4-1b]